MKKEGPKPSFFFCGVLFGVSKYMPKSILTRDLKKINMFLFGFDKPNT
jgi:hypothetical protein